jgi:hypothetical protein
MSFIVNPNTFNYSITQSGLVFNLDAKNINSFPGTGTTWFDLSRNPDGNNAVSTLSSGPSNANSIPPIYNKGVINFNKVSFRQMVVPNNPSTRLTTGTVGVWVKVNASSSGFAGIVTKRDAWGIFTNNNVLLFYSWGVGGGVVSTGININDNQWRYVTLAFSGATGTPSNNATIYVNGIPQTTGTLVVANNMTWWTAIAWGSCCFPPPADAEQFLNGSIGEVHMYNRRLTDDEILYNFNAVKWWYGL